MTPGLLLFLSIVVAAIGGFFGMVGLINASGGMTIIGSVIGGIAGIGMFVALIAIGVSMGIKAARA